MSNKDVIKSFIEGKVAKSSNGNLWVSADNTRLFNYATCIAQRLADGSFIVNSTKYSVSTSKIQNMVRTMLHNCVEVTNVGIGTSYIMV